MATKKKSTKKAAAQKPRAKRKTVETPVPASSGKTSKKDLVLGLLQREDGATLAELMSATGWQAHSVRGFISGTLRKKLGLTIERHGEGGYKATNA
jgi:hypothetical protein